MDNNIHLSIEKQIELANKKLLNGQYTDIDFNKFLYGLLQGLFIANAISEEEKKNIYEDNWK